MMSIWILNYSDRYSNVVKELNEFEDVSDKLEECIKIYNVKYSFPK